MMRRGIILSAAAAALGIGGLGMPVMPRGLHEHGRAPPRYRTPAGPIYTPNGRREVARRLRQIQAGKLKVTPDAVG